MPREPKGVAESLLALSKMGPPRPGLKIGPTPVDEYVVSTVLVNDLECWETAILVRGNFNPVERYDEREEAERGHQRWCEAIPHLTEITKLGYGDLVRPEKVKLPN